MTLDVVPVRVLLFGYYRELAGAGEIELELPAGSRIDDLIAEIRSDPALDGIPSAPAVAVNLRYASGAHVLAPDDEIALIPPVAGG